MLERLKQGPCMLASLALASLVLAMPAAATVTQVPLPIGADNIEFQFAPGTCRDRIGLGHIGGSVVTYTYRGCRGDILTIDFVYNDQPTGMALFGVFPVGAPETQGRQTVTIVDAWWTKGKSPSGDGIFYEPIWPTSPGGGTGHVMAVPEPAAWSLLVAGFGLCGAALRHRHRRRHRRPLPG